MRHTHGIVENRTLRLPGTGHGRGPLLSGSPALVHRRLRQHLPPRQRADLLRGLRWPERCADNLGNIAGRTLGRFMLHPARQSHDRPCRDLGDQVLLCRERGDTSSPYPVRQCAHPGRKWMHRRRISRGARLRRRQHHLRPGVPGRRLGADRRRLLRSSPRLPGPAPPAAMHRGFRLGLRQQSMGQHRHRLWGGPAAGFIAYSYRIDRGGHCRYRSFPPVP